MSTGRLHSGSGHQHLSMLLRHFCKNVLESLWRLLVNVLYHTDKSWTNTWKHIHNQTNFLGSKFLSGISFCLFLERLLGKKNENLMFLWLNEIRKLKNQRMSQNQHRIFDYARPIHTIVTRHKQLTTLGDRE